MKVFLVTNYAPDCQESMLRFGRMLAEGLPAHGIEPILIAPIPRMARLVAYRYAGWPKYLGYADKFMLFPRHLQREIARQRPALVHVLDHANSAYAADSGSVPVLVTCHDLLQIRAARGEIPQQQPGWSGRIFQRWILRQLSRAKAIACVSQKTREDLHRLSPATPSRTHLIPNGLNHPYAPVPRETARLRLQSLPGADLTGMAGGFYLNVGGGQWYKNRSGLLKIFSGLRRQINPPPALVMVGKPLSPADAALAADLGLTAHLRHFSNLSNDSLAALYSLAQGMIFPSWDEGFGWPIAEAQACGCPVFTSNRPPMTEVGGDAAVYFDPADPADAVSRIVSAQSERAALRTRGLARSKLWAAENMLAEYAALYCRLAGVPHENPARN